MRGTKYQTIEDRRVRAADVVHPMQGESFFSLVFFRWANPLMAQSHTAALETKDLWPLAHDNQCKHISAKFEAKFRQTKSIVTTFLSIFGWRFLFIGFLQLLVVASTLYGPYVLFEVVSAIEGDADVDVVGIWLLLASLFAVKVVQAFLSTHTAFQNDTIVLRFTSAVQQLVFQKALLLDAKAQKDKSPADIANLFTADIMWIISAANYTHQSWIIPMQLGALLYFLYFVLGYAALVGAALILLTLALNNALVSGQRAIWKRFVYFRSERAAAVTRFFAPATPKSLETPDEPKEDTASEHSRSGPEPPEDRAAGVAAARSAELGQLSRAFTVAAGVTTLLYSAPVLVTAASLAFHTLVQHETVTAAKVFTALALFRSLRGPLIGFPQIVGNGMQAVIAHRRLMAFMGLSEKDPRAVTTPTDLTAAQYQTFAKLRVDVAVENGSFGWDADKPVFSALNLTLKRGETVVVHGSVGQGKSSLCSALLGELDLYEGSVFVGGRVAYCAQEPWLQRASVLDNILFGKPFEPKKYAMVLDACHLRDDLRTVGGDRAVATTMPPTLQAKVALARACYSDADIYLLDLNGQLDLPLFHAVVLGLLRHKTVLLVSLHPDIVHSKAIDRALELVDGALVPTLANTARPPVPPTPALPARKGFWEEHPQALEREAPLSLEAPDTLMSPSLRSPYGFFAEELSYALEDPAAAGADGNHRVSRAIVAAYLAAAGWGLVLFVLAVQAGWQGLQVASDLWLGHWTSAQRLVDAQAFLAPNASANVSLIVFPGHNTDAALAAESAAAFARYHVQVYAILAAGSVAMVVFRTLATSCAGLRASRRLSSRLAAVVLVPGPAPSSTLQAVLAGDVTTVDTQLPFAAGAFLANVFIAIFALGTAVYFLRSAALPTVLALYGYYYVSAFYATPLQDIDRLARSTRTPHLQFVAEAVAGAVALRAFGMKQVRRFHRLHMTHVNAHLEATYAHETLLQWFSLRMQLLHAALMLAMVAAAVSLRGVLAPGVVGLVFNYALLVPPHVEFLVNLWSALAAALASVGHVLAATDPLARV
ncbi:ATP-binding Cassette (ABC) Superfamily [Achlya hypogyna]|uniref:ATP-binding Cassette (ABC) Superfamily n=1 Tax=Achlya hypogyna TaxID=1202772 RepID=A0A1V9ZB39_ACHHY|nr:ATP-binding Cassette (ABC) Superfamily [Achlya hypogyna]